MHNLKIRQKKVNNNNRPFIEIKVPKQLQFILNHEIKIHLVIK